MVIYWLFPDLNPFLPSLLFCPMLAILIGVWFAFCTGNIYLPLSLALLLPLTFIATDWATVQANIDAWIVYGFIYAVITFVVYRMVFLRLGKTS